MATMPDPEAIRSLAYKLWQQREPRAGTAEDDWHRAEEMLRSDNEARTAKASATEAQKKTDDAVKQSFPASDPPSSHLPDVPPVNADAKWAAARRANPGASSRPTPRNR